MTGTHARAASKTDIRPAAARSSFTTGTTAQVASGASLQAVSVLAYGFATVLVARQVTPAVFAELAVGTAIALIGKDALDLGRSAALVQIQACGGTATRGVARRLILTKLLWSPAILAPLAIASLAVGEGIHLYMLLFWLYTIGYAIWQTLITPVQALAKLAMVSSCAAQERIVTVAVIAASLPILGPSSLPLGLAVGAATVCLRLSRPSWPEAGRRITLKELTRTARPFAVVSLTSDAQQLDVPLVAAVAGAASGGMFAAASRLMGPLGLLTNQAAALVFARASKTEDSLTPRQALSIVGFMAAVYLPGLGFICWQSDALVRMLLGDQYAASADLLQILSIGVALSVVNAPLAAWMQARGASRLVAGATSASVAGYFGVLAVGATHGSMTTIAAAYPLMQALTLAILGGKVFARGLASAAQGRGSTSSARTETRTGGPILDADQDREGIA